MVSLHESAACSWLAYISPLLVHGYPTWVRCLFIVSLHESAACSLLAYMSPLLVHGTPTWIRCLFMVSLHESAACSLLAYISRLLVHVWPTWVCCLFMVSLHKFAACFATRFRFWGWSQASWFALPDFITYFYQFAIDHLGSLTFLLTTAYWVYPF